MKQLKTSNVIDIYQHSNNASTTLSAINSLILRARVFGRIAICKDEPNVSNSNFAGTLVRRLEEYPAWPRGGKLEAYFYVYPDPTDVAALFTAKTEQQNPRKRRSTAQSEAVKHTFSSNVSPADESLLEVVRQFLRKQHAAASAAAQAALTGRKTPSLPQQQLESDPRQPLKKLHFTPYVSDTLPDEVRAKKFHDNLELLKVDHEETVGRLFNVIEDLRAQTRDLQLQLAVMEERQRGRGGSAAHDHDASPQLKYLQNENNTLKQEYQKLIRQQGQQGQLALPSTDPSQTLSSGNFVLAKWQHQLGKSPTSHIDSLATNFVSPIPDDDPRVGQDSSKPPKIEGVTVSDIGSIMLVDVSHLFADQNHIDKESVMRQVIMDHHLRLSSRTEDDIDMHAEDQPRNLLDKVQFDCGLIPVKIYRRMVKQRNMSKSRRKSLNKSSRSHRPLDASVPTPRNEDGTLSMDADESPVLFPLQKLHVKRYQLDSVRAAQRFKKYHISDSAPKEVLRPIFTVDEKPELVSESWKQHGMSYKDTKFLREIVLELKKITIAHKRRQRPRITSLVEKKWR